MGAGSAKAGRGRHERERAIPRRARLRAPARVEARSDDAALEATALALGEPAPDAEPFVMGECVFQALVTHLATHADPLGFACGAALFGKERLRVRLRAQRAFLPLRSEEHTSELQSR